MMRSASREALVQLELRQRAVLGPDASAEALTSLAGELYSVADLLVAQPRLRRTLGDPATAPERRAQFVGQLLSGRVSPAAVEVAQAAVGQRWSSPWDLTDCVELAGDDTLFAAAQQQGALDEVEDELFRFERILATQSQLTTLLDEGVVAVSRRTDLLWAVIGAKVHPVTLALLTHAVASDRKRSIMLAIDDLLDAAAARRERSVARVLTAVELSAEQHTRLAAALSALYGRAISIRSAVDPAVRGGLVVYVGDEVIDGSVAARLMQARISLAG